MEALALNYSTIIIGWWYWAMAMYMIIRLYWLSSMDRGNHQRNHP